MPSVPSDPVTYYTALHIAVLRNQPDVVELLVRHGADINRRDRVRAGPASQGECSRAPMQPQPPPTRLVLSWRRSTRAAPWIWPARSPSACPAYSGSWTSELMSTQPTDMVGASEGRWGSLGPGTL